MTNNVFTIAKFKGDNQDEITKLFPSKIMKYNDVIIAKLGLSNCIVAPNTYIIQIQNSGDIYLTEITNLSNLIKNLENA